ncbi:MAG TPA: nucleotide pyrophosphatase/phosphodiesterase family protein [Pseudonocardia sp.]
MDQPVVPEYGRRSLAEVLPAAVAALGYSLVSADTAPLVLPSARAVAVLLVDGLGHELLQAHADDAPFLAGLADAGPLTVGFPSTTAVSLTSLGTGLPPGAHGILGTSVRVNGELLDALHWRSHVPNGADLRKLLVPEQVQPHPTVLEQAEAAGIGVHVVTARAVRGSGLTRAALRGGTFHGVAALGDLAAELITAMRQPGPQLVYGYHADLDAMGHGYGPGSFPWRLQLRQIDALAGLIAEALPSDGLLLVTADHGMVTVDRTLDADTHPDLQRDVAAVGGDPRARHVYARPGAAADVLATWQAVLGDAAWVVPGEEAVAEGWFGPLGPHIIDRVGDVVIASRGSAAVIRSVAEPVISRLPGQHGSLSRAEQLVPLLLHQT